MLKANLIVELEHGPKGYVVYISEKQIDPASYGETDLVNREVIISPKQTLDEAVRTFLHEYLHVKMPRHPEKYIYKYTYALWGQMTIEDKERLFRALAIAAVWDD